MINMNKCNQKIKYTCDGEKPAVCIRYEGEVNTNSEYTNESCLSIEETTQDIYNQLEDINLSELGNSCLEYVSEQGRLKVKSVLLKLEEEICTLKEKITELEERPLCDYKINNCIDTSCLVDACGEQITTYGQLMQAIVDRLCD